MRRFIFTLLIILTLSITAYGQSDSIMLDWDTTVNSVVGSVELTGTANIPDQQIFFVEAAPYDAAAPITDLWTPVVLPQFIPVTNSTIGTWDTTSVADGIYQLRLHVVDASRQSHYYAIAPIAVNNGGTISNPNPVQVIEIPDEVVAEPEPVTDDNGMIPSPAVINNLPIPVGGHVRHFDDTAKSFMKDAGMTWVKWQVPYFEGTDLAIARDRINWSHEAGFKVLLSITGEKHALDEALNDPSSTYLDDYAAFLGGVAGLGTDAIEVWNEMNLDREWPTGKIDPSTYAIMLEKSYNAIKASNPETMVITGALAPTGAEGAFGLGSVWNDDRYYQGMANAGVANFSDCIGVHYNEGILPPTSQGGDPRGEYPTRYLPLMLNRVAFPFRAFDIPMCMTEMGYLSPEGYGPLPDSFNWAANVDVQEQATWLAQAIQITANFQQMPAELVIVWNIDFDNYEDDPQAGFAIMRPDGTCPACDTIAALE
jgi:hypothetical protein